MNNDYITRLESYRESLYRIAYSYMNDQTLAIDVLDEAYYKAYVNRKKLKNPKYLKTWFTRILINECLQAIRKNKRIILMDQVPEQSIEDYDRLPLKMAIRQLPEKLSKIIYLRYYGGYTLIETAEILEIPLGTVSTRERKALGLIRLELTE